MTISYRNRSKINNIKYIVAIAFLEAISWFVSEPPYVQFCTSYSDMISHRFEYKKSYTV